jgi:RNA polymerase sigma-70 factor (ECF subfamily)
MEASDLAIEGASEPGWCRPARDFVAGGGFRQAVAVVASIYGDVAEAEDAVSEAMTRACEREAAGEPIRDWRAWVIRVALNQSASLARRLARARRRRHLVARPDAWEAEGVDTAQDTLSALRRLPEGQRASIVLHYYADMSVAEIADVRRTSVAAVKTSLHKGRVNLAKRLNASADR